MLYYAGIGSRKTPDDILDLMTGIAGKLSLQDYTLRSGHADGADQAFELGAFGKAEIYLPWQGFNKDREILGEAILPQAWATPIAEKAHPRWKYLSRSAKLLHARNVHQIFGKEIFSEKSVFVVCWTKNAKGEGGTGQAIRLCKDLAIPVFDLADPSVYEKLWSFAHTPLDINMPLYQ